ncbi:Uncharacterised protein [Escherichia coli]|uniref:hypothetical protein n=1 Tax=Escherichia coli TaxID=562 RepID=UPI001A52F731|nr:hypothetical protein [Escherichia coli]VVZ71302.1 Uncharacterised protein [Escherichia coli]VWN20933.1 Uncharacterised protein [Escherichia coli]
MTNKFIVSTVDCINEFASDVPQSVSLRIDTMLEQRIRKLAAYVKENDLHLTEFYFYEALLKLFRPGMSRQRLHHGEDLSAILISPSPPFWSLNACSG